MEPLTKVAIWLLVGVPLALAMEPWAAFLHGRVWHSWGWFWHRSHHEPKTGYFEANDLFAVLHALPAIGLILYGCVGPVGVVREVCFGVGLGLTAFGWSYAIVHDGLVHGRLPVQFLLRLRYFRRIVAAHRVHHERGAEPYGLFRGPQELAARARRLQGAGPTTPPELVQASVAESRVKPLA
jgi:beta-carotene 3-hydroxylase